MTKSALILFFALVAFMCFTSTTYFYVQADSMFVDGKEITLDPDIPALYQYINAPDSNFAWKESEYWPPYNDTKKELTIYAVEFTSQRWLTDDDTDRSLWHHNFTIIVPWKLKLFDVGMVYVTGCLQDSTDCIKKEIVLVQDLAIKSGAILAILTQIPNSRMVFPSDPIQKSRSEDAIVAFTWRKVLENPSRPDWIVYNPMAKATVRSFDVLEQWSTKKFSQGVIPTICKKFYVAGASKRGATTWFTSAYMGIYQPNRLFGAAPMVFDVLNFTHTVSSMMEQLGGWTFAFTDYMDQDIISYFNHVDKLQGLVKHIDLLEPWYYAGLKAIPKLIVSATGDEFFLPLNDRYYYDKVPSSHRLMAPNTEHSLATGLEYIFNAVIGHMTALAKNLQLPKLQHQMDWKNNTIRLKAWPKPSNVAVWRGNSLETVPPRKDFRMIKAAIEGNCLPPAFVIEDKCIANIEWKHINIPGTYEPQTDYWSYTWTEHEIPTNNTWIGLYIMATWDGPITGSQVYTTQTMILPDKMPFDSCFGDDKHCETNLV